MLGKERLGLLRVFERRERKGDAPMKITVRLDVGKAPDELNDGYYVSVSDGTNTVDVAFNKDRLAVETVRDAIVATAQSAGTEVDAPVEGSRGTL